MNWMRMLSLNRYIFVMMRYEHGTVEASVFLANILCVFL